MSTDILKDLGDLCTLSSPLVLEKVSCGYIKGGTGLCPEELCQPNLLLKGTLLTVNYYYLKVEVYCVLQANAFI